MSQYNWSWWFVITLLTMTIGMLVAMTATNTNQMWIANVVCAIGLINFFPCLYIGMKPYDNK